MWLLLLRGDEVVLPQDKRATHSNYAVLKVRSRLMFSNLSKAGATNGSLRTNIVAESNPRLLYHTQPNSPNGG